MLVMEVYFLLESTKNTKSGEEMTGKYYDQCQPDRQLMVLTYYDEKTMSCFFCPKCVLLFEMHQSSIRCLSLKEKLEIDGCLLDITDLKHSSQSYLITFYGFKTATSAATNKK
ncbi:CLUMA_CG000502, isoform A [Clunio marinus]|uniref:CLUMA_CG000502, isoform A n=1 Tax=Clunio marinus TaxID=568069 RepID=A0A1J1HGJ1_9DIPT|nr:CLUMA_CG000502, isoform A [Clunio marinus]